MKSVYNLDSPDERDRRHRGNGVRATMFVGDVSSIELDAPRAYKIGNGADGVTGWILGLGDAFGHGDVTLHFNDVETIRRLHATLGLALDDVDAAAAPVAVGSGR